MKVFKFGGAAVNNVERIQNLATILQQYKDEKLIIIISAMGKTTNALEKVAEAFYAEKKEEALQLFDVVKKQHPTTMCFGFICASERAVYMYSTVFSHSDALCVMLL